MPCCCVSSGCNLGLDFSIGLDKFTIKCVRRRADKVFACRWTMVMIPMVMMPMVMVMMLMITMRGGGASARLSSACLSTSSQKIDHGGSQVYTAL